MERHLRVDICFIALDEFAIIEVLSLSDKPSGVKIYFPVVNGIQFVRDA